MATRWPALGQYEDRRPGRLRHCRRRLQPLAHARGHVGIGDHALVELEVLIGFDDDLVGESFCLANRIQLLARICPALERVLGLEAQHRTALELLPPAAV